MQNFQNPITLFHKILACFWLFGMVFLSFGVVTAQTATDRQNHSEVGLMLKPLTAASKWLIRKQVKAFFGDIEAQAVITTNDIVGNILMQVQYAWEKAWQTAILQAALKLISAIFKIISDFVNKLMDMIGNIGNLNAVLAPFASSIVGVARSAYSKVVACADYWARRELQEVLPAIDTGAKGRECPWLNEEDSKILPDTTEKLIGTTDEETTQAINRGMARIAANSNKLTDTSVEGFVNAAAEAQSISKTIKLEGCTTGDWFLDQLSGVACYAPIDNALNNKAIVDQEKSKITAGISSFKEKVDDGVAGENLLNGNVAAGNSLTLVPSKAFDRMVIETKKRQQLPQVPEYFNPKAENGDVTYKIFTVPNPNWLDRQLDVLTAQSTQNPQPGGSAEKSFSETLSKQFSKMLDDLITNVLESVVFKIVDFISDSLLKAINFFLGPDSILGGLGLDSVAGDLVNTMRDGIKDSVSSIGKSISDPLAKDRENNLNAVAVFRCDGKLYWQNTSGYELAKQANCETVGTDFQGSGSKLNWCKDLTKEEFDYVAYRLYNGFIGIYINGEEVPRSKLSEDNMKGLIQRTCSEQFGKFELKT